MIERALRTSHKLHPYFWSKKKAAKFNHNVYVINSRLHAAFNAVAKNSTHEVLLATFKRFNHKQLKKIVELATYNQVGVIISTLQFHCTREIERRERIARPKDIGDARPVDFEAGEDLRNNDEEGRAAPSLTTWEIINGKDT